MKPGDFKKWMKANDVTPVDIAAFLKINPATVTRFIEGKSKNPHRNTLNGYKKFVTWFSSNKQNTGGQKAAVT